MMIEKECGIVDNTQFPSLWNTINSSGSIVQLVTTMLDSEQLVITYSYNSQIDIVIKLRGYAKAAQYPSTAEYLPMSVFPASLEKVTDIIFRKWALERL
jgi:hypothetical protein